MGCLLPSFPIFPSFARTDRQSFRSSTDFPLRQRTLDVNETSPDKSKGKGLSLDGNARVSGYRLMSIRAR